MPRFLLDYCRVVFLNLKYPGRQILSPMVANNARLGAKCSIARGVEIGPRVSLGDYSYVNAGTIIASGTIGKYCSIGYWCQIGMPTHPKARISTSPKTYGQKNVFNLPNSWNDFAAPPQIGNDVWIGSSAQIMQGVHIGHGAIVAAGAIVTKDVYPYSIVGGIPAHSIGMRIDESLANELLSIAWWDLSVAELTRHAAFFQKPIVSADELHQLKQK
jgi:virginiamycin A acetyltransferase